MLPKIIIILGPTGSGKSGLAIKLAQRFHGEIISADSRQIYRGFVIGSGVIAGLFEKDSYKAGGISHHLVQFLSPNKTFSAAEFKALAIDKIKEIRYRNNLPFIVGGTGLYIDAVVNNLSFSKIKPNLALRQKLEQKTKDELLSQLKALGSRAAQEIDVNNKRRIIRALEIILLGDADFFQAKPKGKKIFDALKIGINLERQELYKRIDRRIEEMLEAGLIQETEDLLKLYSKSAPAFSGIGYQQVVSYLEGNLAKNELAQKIKFATHAYARRQITWFKKDKDINWIKSLSEAQNLIEKFL